MTERRQVDINPNELNAMKAALDDIREVILKHDSRVMALVLLDRAVTIYGHLKTLGYVTVEQVEAAFAEGLVRVRDSSKQPKVEMRGDVPSSEVPS